MPACRCSASSVWPYLLCTVTTLDSAPPGCFRPTTPCFRPVFGETVPTGTFTNMWPSELQGPTLELLLNHTWDLTWMFAKEELTGNVSVKEVNVWEGEFSLILVNTDNLIFYQGTFYWSQISSHDPSDLYHDPLWGFEETPATMFMSKLFITRIKH